MYKNIGTRIPGSVIKDIEYVAREEQTDKSKVVRELISEAIKMKMIEIALKKYSQRKISLGKATEIAKIPLTDFMNIAMERKIPMNYSIDSLKKDFKAALK